MFIYLSKKIAIPNNVQLKCLSWNADQGFIACGGDDGMLKVLKLEAQATKDSRVRGLAAPSNLSMNQTLEGHSGVVQVVTWNPRFQKLTTSDDRGLITVWMLYKSAWYEEMINNRNKSVVVDMRWNNNGQKICIVYEDGAVIVGSVDGNRIWGKELKDVTLSFVEWSADGKVILFALSSGEVRIYDCLGNYLSNLETYGTEEGSSLASLQWYHGGGASTLVGGVSGLGVTIGAAEHVPPPTLALCYTNGRCQLMRKENDIDAVLFDTGIEISDAKWSCNGELLAVAGTLKTGDKDVNIVNFYSPMGQLLRTLKVPGKKLHACSWDGSNLRISLAIDSFIYFANLRPDYKWGYFSNTVVYSFNKPDRVENCVMFWNTKTREKYIKFIKNLVAIICHDDYCCMIIKTEEMQYALTLCNSIGTPMLSKYIEMQPLFYTMTSTHITIASEHTFYSWNYRFIKGDQFDNKIAAVTATLTSKRIATSEKLLHIDDIPSGAGGLTLDFNKIQTPSNDPITCVCASKTMLFIGRESGVINQYSYPQIMFVHKHKVSVSPTKLAVNSTSSRLSIIDTGGLLSLFDFENKTTNDQGQEVIGEHIKVDRKDVWDMKWATDNSELLAVMEKTRMFILRGTQSDDPVLCSGYLADFSDLQLKSVLLDEIMQYSPENPSIESIIDLDTKSLRDVKEILESTGVVDAQQFIEDHSHPRLWRLLGETALTRLELSVAEHAYVRCKDYKCIQFIKRLTSIQNEQLKQAEIAAYFNRFDEAERIYLNMDRRDLAVSLRKKLGDWFRVVQLLKTGGGGGDDKALEHAWNSIGDYYADRQKWLQAVTYYVQSRNQEQLAMCYYNLQDFENLNQLMLTLPDNHSILSDIGDMFKTVGMCEESVNAFVKCGQPKDAINTCVQLNQWNQAMRLAEKYLNSSSREAAEVNNLMTSYADHLTSKKHRRIDAVELFNRAGDYLKAVKFLNTFAEEERKKGGKPLRIKKLYILSGHLVVKHHEKQSKLNAKNKQETSNALNNLLQDKDLSVADTKLIDTCWRGAEAYHYLIMAQRQLFQGKVEDAMKTSLHLREYDDFINSQDIYSLIALISSACKAFGVCSKAFIKLESIENLPKARQIEYENLALQIFTRHNTKDPRPTKAECTNCETVISDWSTICPNCDTKFPTCIITGRPIFAFTFWVCKTCKHQATQNEIFAYTNCPFCHCKIN